MSYYTPDDDLPNQDEAAFIPELHLLIPYMSARTCQCSVCHPEKYLDSRGEPEVLIDEA